MCKAAEQGEDLACLRRAWRPEQLECRDGEGEGRRWSQRGETPHNHLAVVPPSSSPSYR